MIYLTLQFKNLALTICALILILIFLAMLIASDYELFRSRLALGQYNQDIDKILTRRKAYYRDLRDKKIITERKTPIIMHNNKFEERLGDDVLELDEIYFDELAFKKKRLPYKISSRVVAYLLSGFLFVFSLILCVVPGLKENLITNDATKFLISFFGCYEFLSCSVSIILALIYLDYFSDRKEQIFIDAAKDRGEEVNELQLSRLSDTNVILRT